MAVHDPDGSTMVPSVLVSARSVRRATRRASGAKPLFQAGWPQQVAPLATVTSWPRRCSIRTVALLTAGLTSSTRQVGKTTTFTPIKLTAVGTTYLEVSA